MYSNILTKAVNLEQNLSVQFKTAVFKALL